MNFSPGDSVGPYRVTGVIGEGANGVVYQVVNTVTGRLEAMKVLTGEVSKDLAQVERFLREIQLQSKLQHPNIAQVRTAFCEGGTLVMIMEQVEGEALDVMLTRALPAPIHAMRIADQVLQALGYAHGEGVIHRDVKPGNILIDKNGQVKLTDFGLARQQTDPSKTLPGVAVGTVYYMSPEQVRALGPVDKRSDLYSAGIVLYELLTGHKPFSGEEQFAIMRAQVETEAPPPSFYRAHLPPAVDQVLAKALHKDPEQRFQTADEFRAAVAALPSAWMIPPAPPKQFNPAVKFGAIMCGTAILALSAVALPPWVASLEPAIEGIQAKLPPPPTPPADALERQIIEPAPAPEVALPVPSRTTVVRRAVPPPPQRQLAGARLSHPEPLPLEPAHPRQISPPGVRAETPTAPPPASSKQKQAPAAQSPDEKQDPHWMRRTVRGFPWILRRRQANSELKQKQ